MKLATRFSYDSDDDGIMTGRIGTNISNGEYHVDYIRLEDDLGDNYAYYRKSGVIEIYDRQMDNEI